MWSFQIPGGFEVVFSKLINQGSGVSYLSLAGHRAHRAIFGGTATILSETETLPATVCLDVLATGPVILKVLMNFDFNGRLLISRFLHEFNVLN